MSVRRSIPVRFVGDRLAVSAAHARQLLGYDGHSEPAWRKAWYRFRQLNGIRPIPGTAVYPLRKIEKAVEA